MNVPKSEWLPNGKKIRFHRLRFMWLRLRFAFDNHYTVDLDSPAWKEELDNIAEIEEDKLK